MQDVRPGRKKVGSYYWYCQIPGKLWVTEQCSPEYRLQYRVGSYTRTSFYPGWWLVGEGREIRLSGWGQMQAAMQLAVPHMKRSSRPCRLPLKGK